MSIRRFTRLTNAFSKKIEKSCALSSSALRVSPAMAAGVTDRLWTISDIVNLVEKSEAH